MVRNKAEIDEETKGKNDPQKDSVKHLVYGFGSKTVLKPGHFVIRSLV